MSGADPPRRRPRSAAALAPTVALLVALSGCGDTSSRPAWVAGHPDTALLSFETTAPGVCAITVQYPNDAPAVIGYLGGVYVQVSRRPHPSTTPSPELDHSGDWHVFKVGNAELLLLTSGDAFVYRLEQNC